MQDPAVKDPVTAVISHQARPGRESGYEEWLKGIAAMAKTFPGYLGVSIIRPLGHEHPEYVSILRFDGYGHLKGWLESPQRQEWIERSKPLIIQKEDIQFLTGLETWFSLSKQPNQAPPPPHKMAIVT